MKLFHHGYRGKHERGQVPPQRDDDPGPHAVDDQEAQEGQERVSDPRPADLPAQRRPPRSASGPYLTTRLVIAHDRLVAGLHEPAGSRAARAGWLPRRTYCLTGH